MAKGFNLTAELNLRGPSNIRQVVSNINKQLKSVKTSVNFNIDPNSAKNIASVNKNLVTLNKNLTTVLGTAKSVSSTLSNVGSQFNSMSTAANKAASSTANVSSNISNTGKQAQSAAAQLSKSTTIMEDFGKQSALAVKRFAAFSLVTSAVFSLTNAIDRAFKQFIEFDRQLVRLQQVTDKTADGLKNISREITNLSQNLGVSSSELISVSTTLAQAGLSARETEKALKALALSALAPSFDDLNRTVEGSIALMRQFGISAGDLEKALGSVNAVAASFAVEAGDIIAAIQRTGGVFAAASRGVSEGTDALNEFVAVFTSVRATTRESAETIATGLRTIFTRIQRGSTIEALKEFGITLTDVDGKFVGAYKAIQLLSQGLNQLDPRDVKFSTLVEELGGFRQIGKVIPLIQQFATAQKALAVAQAGQGSLAEDAATAQLSLSNQIAKVREEFLGLIREIGGTDSFKAITKSALDLASALIQIADSVKGVLPVLGVLLAGKGLRAGFGFAKGFTKELKGKASGGLVTKYATGGLVDVALMPGETVVSPEVVKKIGVGTLNRMNKADKMAKGGLAKGGLAKVPGTGRADSFYTQIPEKSYVIRTDATNALGDKTISDIASGRQKFADGGQTKKTQQGKQVGGVGVFDSDMIGAGSKQILNAIRSSGKPYSVISGPAGSGKTTFATRKFGKNFIRSVADIEKYARFAVLSGAGATKTGDFSSEAQSLMSGAAQVIALQPSSEQVMSQRQQRIADAESSGLPDTRSIGQLKGTMKAPTQIDSNLYKKFGNVQFVQKFEDGGKVYQSKKKYGMLVAEEGNPADIPMKSTTNKKGDTYQAGIRVSGFQKTRTFNKKIDAIDDTIDSVSNELAQSIKVSSLNTSGTQKAKNIASTVKGTIFENYVLTAAGLPDPGNAPFDIQRANATLKSLTKDKVTGLTDIKLNNNDKQQQSIIKKAVKEKPSDFVEIAQSDTFNTEDATKIPEAAKSKKTEKVASALGGLIQKFDIGGEVKAGMVISDILDNKSGKVPISAKDVAFANPQVPPLTSGSIAKLYAAPTGNKIQIGSASQLPLKDIEGIISRTVLGGSTTKTYNTEVAGVGERQNKVFNLAIQKYTKEAIENSAKAWGRSANVSVSNVEFAEDFSIPGGQVGSMFEQMIQGLAGEPIAAASSEDKRPFDFTNGLGRLVKRGDTGLFTIDEKINYVDAKKGINSTLPSEFKKKISNQLAIEDFSKVQAAIQQRMNERKDSTKQQGVEGPTRDIPVDLKTGVHSGSELAQRLSVKNSASAISKLGFEKSGKGWSYRQRKQASMASGGEVPILAQEGEYVINRNSARSIGYGNLEKLNKYHSGGMVQKFASGGSVIPAMQEGGILKRLGSVLGSLIKPISSLIPTFTKAGTAVNKTANSMTQAAQAIQSQVKTSNTNFARTVSGGFVPSGTTVRNAASADPDFVRRANQAAISTGAATAWSPAVSQAMSGTAQATRSGRAGGSQTVPAQSPDIDTNKAQSALDRFSSLATSVAVGLPLLTTAINGNREAQTAQEAQTQALTNSLATNIGVFTLVASEISSLTKDMKGFKGGVARVGGALASVVTGGFLLIKSFTDAQEAARKFAIESSTKKIEEGSENIKSVFDKLAKNGKPLSTELGNLNNSLAETAAAAQTAAENMNAQRGTVIQTLAEGILGGGSANFSGGQQGATNRSIIAQEKGTFAYLAVLGDTNKELKYMSELAPKLAKESSKMYAEAAKQVEDVMVARFKEGESLQDIFNSANWEQNAELIARQNAAIEKQIILIETDTRLSANQKQAMKDNIIALEAQKVALEKFKQIETEKALKDLDNAANRLSYSFSRILSNMDEAIARSVSSLNKLDSAMQNSISSLSGQATSGSSTGIQKLLDVINNPRAFSRQERAGAFTSATAGFGGSADSIGKVLELGSTIEDSILGAVNSAVSSAPAGTTQEKIGSDVSNAVRQKLKNIGLPPELSKKLSAEIGKQVAKLRQSGDDNIDFSEIVEKVPAVGKALESFKTASSAVENRLKFLQSAFDQLSATTNQLINLQIDSNSRFLRSQEIVMNGYMALSQALGKNITLSQQRFAIESRTRGRTGGTTDPAQIRRNITNLSDRKENLEQGKAAAQTAGDVNAVQDFEKQIKQTSVSLNENVAALKDMAENTDLASAALNKIEQAQQKQRAGIGIIEKLVTSTPKQLNELNQSALRLSRNMSGVANFGTTSEQRGQDLELFNMIAPLLGDQAEPLKANVLQSMLQQSGVGITPMFQQILDTMRNPQADPVQAEAIKTYQDAIQKQSEANIELANINNNLANDIANQTQKGIEAAIKNSVVRFDDKQITDLLSGINNPGADQPAPVPAVGIATGGLIYKAGGGNVNTIFKPKGTDTVPAMLTPGEFVVNKASTQQHLPLLQSINKSKGGSVGYYNQGGEVGGLKTNWAKEKRDDEDASNVSMTTLPYVNPKIWDSNTFGKIFGAKGGGATGGYVPVYSGDFDYTDFLTNKIKARRGKEIEQLIGNEMMKLGSDSPAKLIGWAFGNPGDTTSDFIEPGGWFSLEGGSKFPKYSTSNPLPMKAGFKELTGLNNIPGTDSGLLKTASGGESELFYKEKAQPNTEAYAGSTPNMLDANYSIQAQLKLAELAIEKYKELKQKIENIKTIEKNNGLVPVDKVDFMGPSELRFWNKNASYSPKGKLGEPSMYDGVAYVPASQKVDAIPTVQQTVKTFGETRQKKTQLFGKEVTLPGHVGFGPQTVSVADTSRYTDIEPMKSAMDIMKSEAESIKSELNRYVGDPDFFKSGTTANATRNRLADQLKNLESGSLSDLYTTIPSDFLNEEWKGKVGNSGLSLFVDSVKSKWGNIIKGLNANQSQKRRLLSLGQFGDTADAMVGDNRYNWASLPVAKEIVAKYFAGESRTAQDKFAGPGGFDIQPKSVTSFPLGVNFSDIGENLPDDPISAKINVSQFKMPKYSAQNKYSGEGTIQGVEVSDAFNSDISVNPFMAPGLAAKSLFFKDIEEAKQTFTQYYQTLAALYKDGTFANEPGIASLNQLVKIPQIDNLDPNIQKIAKEIVPLDSLPILQDTLKSVKERYLSQVGGEAITGKSATIDPNLKGQDWLDLGVIQDIVRGVIGPFARNIVAMGGRLPNIGSTDGLGAFAEYVSQGADYIGARATSATGMPAIIFGQLKALGEIFSLISQNKKQETLRKLGLPSSINENETPPVLKDATSMVSAIQNYGKFLTEQGALSLGGDASSLNQPVDQNFKLPNGQTIAEIFKSGQVELAEVDATSGTFSSSQASEAQAPKDLKSVGKIILNPYNILPKGVRKSFTDNLVRALTQARYANAAMAVKNVGEYLSLQDSFVLGEPNSADPSIDKAVYQKANKDLVLLTNGVLGLIPDSQKLQQIKAARSQNQKQQEVQNRASGGLIYASNGTLVNFQPKGTDTVPAMLTPGEFVINRQSTQKHLPLLKAINNAGSSGLSSSQAIQRFATGGIVQPKYYQDAGMVSGGNAVMKPAPITIDKKSINDAKTAISKAISEGSNTLASVLSEANIFENSESFVNAISSFTRSVNNIVSNLSNINLPEQIQFTGNVQVNLTGANNLTEAAESIVNNAIKRAFGDLGVANEGSIVIPQQFR